jgi:hypothetical protein
MGYLSLRDSMKGTWREGSFIGDPKKYVMNVKLEPNFYLYVH